jgi:hypothetical protein
MSLFNYPDQAISEVWVDWSENTLSHQHPKKYSRSIGFQLARESKNANDRTRAGEFYRIGLLRGLLVNAKGTSRGNTPFGWQLIQSDQNAHTRLGFFAYALGAAIKRGSKSDLVRNAFELLCTIFLLQTGFRFNNEYVLTSSLFLYLQKQFNIEVADVKFQRYLAAAMFCTLELPEAAVTLMEAYTKAATVDRLWLVTETRKEIEVGSSDLSTMITNKKLAISNVSPPKPSLYWIGNENNTREGLFTVASKRWKSLLTFAADLEREALTSGSESPFRPAILKPNTGDSGCVLEILTEIFSTNSKAKQEWERAMDTLYKGVLDSLRFLKSDDNFAPAQHVFYAHGLATPAPSDSGIVLEVEKSKCAGQPNEQDLVVIDDRSYSIKQVQSLGDKFKITLALNEA